MMRRFIFLSALLLAAGQAPGQAAVVRTQIVTQGAQLAPLPLTGAAISPSSLAPSLQLSAPSLIPAWSEASISVAPSVQAPIVAAPALSQTVQAAETAVPAQAGLSAVAQTLSEIKNEPAAPAEASAIKAAQRFDGTKLSAQDAVYAPEVPVAAPAAAHPLRLIITGPPGSGKGTYSEKIAEEYGVVHISVGELLRGYAKAHPDVAAVMATGKLVDSKLVLDVVRERLSQADIREHGFILDGFPRRGEEAAALEEMLGPASIDGVIELRVPETELLRRILARGRADDKADVFQERMRIYREQTVPAVERFKNAAPVLAPEVSGSEIASNYARVKTALSGLVDRILGR